MTTFVYSTYWRKNYASLIGPRDVCTMPDLQIVVIYYSGKAAVTTWADEDEAGRLDDIRLWLPVNTLGWPAQNVTRKNDEPIRRSKVNA
jgi:hypothetical protein